ncbi:MAG TPA: divalent metal cation transporter [Thermoplasmata archaeon]|nr:divalent metal cation transporter [Thermoplasmata archaeon]
MRPSANPAPMGMASRLYFQYRRFRKQLAILASVIGPGVIVMVADNDAGGITTYMLSGAYYRYSFIWIVLILGPVAYVCQEMTVRLGVMTKRGHAQAIFEAFGPFWGWFSLTDLTLTDCLTITTEFIGMTMAMAVFGIPPVFTEVVVITFVMVLLVNGRYWTWEKVVLAICAVNMIYVPVVFFIHPDVGAIFRTGIVPGFPEGLGGPVIFLIMATIGTTIAPWMIFFQQSSVVDKGLKKRDVPYARWDTAIGATFTVVTAIALIIIASVYFGGNTSLTSAGEAAALLMPLHPWLGTILAIGLFDAGLIGALSVSLASSWAVGEVFGWSHSLNDRLGQARWFNLFRLSIMVIAGAIVLIPGAPLGAVTLFVQVIAVTLLPAALVFLIVLLNQEELVGSYKNTRAQNIMAGSIVGVILALSTLYAVGSLAPQLLGG